MLNKDQVHGRANTLALVVLLSVAGQGQVAAQTHSPGASKFESVFGSPGRVDPIFTRPDVTRPLPPLTARPDEGAPDLQAQGGSESPKKKGVRTLRKVSAPSANAHPSPKEPRMEARHSRSEPSTTARRKQSSAMRRASDRAGLGAKPTIPTQVGSHAIRRRTKVTRADRARAQRGLQAKPKGAMGLSRGSARALGIKGVGSVALHGASGASARQRPKRPPALPVAMRHRAVETTGSIPAHHRGRPPHRSGPTPAAPFVVPEALRPKDL